jgi:uncharacterized protein YktB (UPF0637 family)
LARGIDILSYRINDRLHLRIARKRRRTFDPTPSRLSFEADGVREEFA